MYIERMAANNQPIEQRFWANVLKKKGCWEWTACKMTRGYGQLSWNKKSIGAHRVSFLLSGRTIPDGFIVMHTCDNKGCVNPAHLIAAPQKVNMEDYKKKGILRKKRLKFAKARLGKRPIAQYNYQAKMKRKANAKREVIA